MNYDLDTEEGMKNAVAWTRSLLAKLRTGGVWVVPRSGARVCVDHTKNMVRISAGSLPDPAIARVLLAAGYTITEGETRE